MRCGTPEISGIWIPSMPPLTFPYIFFNILAAYLSARASTLFEYFISAKFNVEEIKALNETFDPNLHESINHVDEKTDEMMAMMSLPSETIQSISRIEPVSAPQTDNKNQIHNIVPLQIIVVYICTKAKQHNKDWDLDLLPPSLREYAAGILVTLNSVSLITIKTNHKTVKVMDIHEVLVEKVAPLIDQVVKDPTLPNIQEIKQNIDAYFL